MYNKIIFDSKSVSTLRGFDLQDFLIEVENFPLTYRDRLSIDSKITFGVEIEYENFPRYFVLKYIEKKKISGYRVKKDSSLSNGGEITSPILHDKPNCWQDLQTICQYLKKWQVETSKNAGGHIHIGDSILKDNEKYWERFLKLYLYYEPVLFRFAYGDKVSGRKHMHIYAPPIASKLYTRLSLIQDNSSLKDLYKVLPELRFQAINFTNVKGFPNSMFSRHYDTLEFRNPNATVEEIVWQNNINTYIKLLTCVQGKNFDEDFLDYQISKIDSSHFYFYRYQEILLQDALEFADIVFNNNLDKLYFLKQYLKGFQNNSGMEKAISMKRM